MLRNYLKTALRNLWRNKAFSAINIFGLAFGLACSLLIWLWVQDEYYVDGFHKNGSRLYSLYEQQFRDAEANAFFGGPGIMADEMKRQLPDVEYATNYAWNDLRTFEANGKIIKKEGNHAGADFFRMFSFPLIQGNPKTALLSLGDISISKRMAEEFFGSAPEAMGKSIRFEDRKNYKISAVFADLPQNSTLQFDYMLTWQDFLVDNGWALDWTNNGPGCFIMLRNGTDAKAFGKKIYRFLDKYNHEQTARSYVRLGMERFGDVYLHSNFDKQGNLSGGRIQYVKIFSAVAIFILLIACINFMNLTTARSIKRAKEIGIRKVSGAVRFALIKQFIGETLFIVSIAIVLGLLLVTLSLPLFNQLTEKHIDIPFYQVNFWLTILGLLCVTGLFSGSYPALYLSSFKPIRVLKGLPSFTNGALWFRKGLVVFQFVLSIFLIVGNIVVRKQVGFIQSMNLGYDRENLLDIPIEGNLMANYKLFKEEALKMPGIKNVSCISSSPIEIVNGTSGVSWEGKDPTAPIGFSHAAVGYDYVKTMHLQLKMGRDFSKDFATDSAGFLINESALKVFDFKDPVGKPIVFWRKPGTIIGVLKDFHINSIHTKISPLILRLRENDETDHAIVRTEAGKTKVALTSLEKICRELNPKFPFTYKFTDLEYAKMYNNEQIIRKLADYFAFLAIFISCLGLLGLVMFASEQRTKEFGIRKVLGANPFSLFNLLSREFILLILIAMLIASPVAWLAMNSWLQDYAYKISISWWMFVIAGIGAIVIALITVSFQAIKAATANPVRSLRSE
jgi:ABC-type lipoprotein release transport system permease subunit